MVRFKHKINDIVETKSLGSFNALVKVKILECYIGQYEPYYRVQEIKNKELIYYRNESEIKVL